MPIRCKLISPTNLLLEHPLYLAPKEDSEFFVITKKAWKYQRREWVFYGAILSMGATTLLLAVFTALR